MRAHPAAMEVKRGPNVLKKNQTNGQTFAKDLSVKEMHDNMVGRLKQVNVSFFAKVGNGKSSSANTLLQAWGYDGPPFEARRARESVTAKLESIEQVYNEPESEDQPSNDARSAEEAEERSRVVLRVTDQPGLMDSAGKDADTKHLRGTALSEEHKDGYHVLFVVEKITDRLDASEQIILRTVKKFYGEAVCRHIVLLLTHADGLDDKEEIDRMIAEARADVEKELGSSISTAIAINNHKNKSDATGRDRITSGRDMIRAIHDIVCEFHEPFKPPEVEYEALLWFVNEEIQRNPAVKRDAVLVRLVSSAYDDIVRRKRCTIL